MAKPASLGAGLISKGQATPAAIALPPAAPVRQAEKTAIKTSEGQDYYKALTVKLDRDRYQALKSAGLALDKKSQQILVEALDLWLSKNKG